MIQNGYGGFPAKTSILRRPDVALGRFGRANFDLTGPRLRIPMASGRSCLGAAACAAARRDVEPPWLGSPSWVEPFEPLGCQLAA